MNLNNYMPVKLFTGVNCIAQNADTLKALGGSCLIVTGKYAAKASGAYDDVTSVLARNGQSWELFDRIGENPRLTDCMDAAASAIKIKADFIIGIGGGSAQDAAKCIAVLTANPGLTQAQLYAFEWANKPKKIVLVGTTAGTGSEVTKVSVITTPDGRKKSFHHEDIFAAVSFGDPRYTMTLSEMTTRSTAVDVLAHCAESYFNRNANHLSRLYAAEGIRLLLPVFRQFVQNGYDAISYETRETLYTASIYGGLAINHTGTAFPHTMGYLLTERFKIPHGTACAVFQREFYLHNKSTDAELCMRFMNEIGSCEEEYLYLTEAVTPPYSADFSEQLITESHSRWINNSSIAKTLGEVSADDIDNILRRCFPGK